MTTLNVCNLRELIIGGMLEARKKISADLEQATKIEQHFYTDDDRNTMREQLAEYDARELSLYQECIGSNALSHVIEPAEFCRFYFFCPSTRTIAGKSYSITHVR